VCVLNPTNRGPGEAGPLTTYVPPEAGLISSQWMICGNRMEIVEIIGV
jgi:hypothetical protein